MKYIYLLLMPSLTMATPPLLHSDRGEEATTLWEVMAEDFKPEEGMKITLCNPYISAKLIVRSRSIPVARTRIAMARRGVAPAEQEQLALDLREGFQSLHGDMVAILEERDWQWAEDFDKSLASLYQQYATGNDREAIYRQYCDLVDPVRINILNDVMEIVGPQRERKFREILARFYFSELNPRCGSEALGISLNDRQIQELERKTVAAEKRSIELMHRLAVWQVTNIFRQLVSEDEIETAFGAPAVWIASVSTHRGDWFSSEWFVKQHIEQGVIPDVAPLAILLHQQATSELELTHEQTEKLHDARRVIMEALPMLVDEPFPDGDEPFRQLRSAVSTNLETDMWKAIDTLLNESQRKRLKQLLTQYYLHHPRPNGHRSSDSSTGNWDTTLHLAQRINPLITRNQIAKATVAATEFGQHISVLLRSRVRFHCVRDALQEVADVNLAPAKPTSKTEEYIDSWFVERKENPRR